ncbi:MAG: HEAT repeat domain-containing protein [Chloroflexota bacterium]|nr:HEAT repeat domain-containing protein [Chloroflexota bacterium]MBI5703848.1 HEAT repeat domain-containing protein [Chloroflexota bacterium]
MTTLQELLNDLTSGDETRAENAVTALTALGERAIPSLLELTRSPDVDIRWWAVRALAQSPHCRTEWLIPFLTEDPAPEIRQCAALGLAVKADESAIQPLVQALSDADGMVGSLAANALVKIGSAAVPALIEVVKAGAQAARILALRALAEIKDQRAIPVMMKVMEEDSSLLQYWAQEGLERLGLNMIYLKPE